MADKGIFIVIEGVDGSGKSTQAARLADWLADSTGKKVVRTAEPFSLRDLILSRKDLSPLSELLLFLADRSEHVEKVIKPALNAGDILICERYNDSTLAYQVGGHKINHSQAIALIDSCRFPEPDAKIFLDLSPELAFERVKTRNKQRNNQDDKFESEGLSLIKKVSEFYKTLPGFIKISCDGLDEDEVFNAIISLLEEKL